MATVARPIRIGRYVLFGELAAGGMASVHWGRLIGTGGFAKTVAIKRLHRQFARDPKFRDSILEEGLLAARIRHPNVVAPLDVLSEGGELLLAMEYVHGEALSKLVRASRNAGERVPLAIVAAILSNVLHGLHAAHEAKDEKGRPLDIVHRDVSPQNVLVGTDGVSRVIDFGIAKAVTSKLESTSAGVIKGKVPYLAPEQLEGDPATRRTDVYAASVVLWEVLAGRRLFEGEDDGEILRKILGMNVPPPSAYNAEVPASVDEVVLRGLARDPAHRYATAREMAIALEGITHLATASIVGEWCERFAAEALAKRAGELAAVEASEKRISSRPPPAPPAAPPPSRRPPPPSPSVRPPPPAPAPPRARPLVSPSASFAGVDPAVTYASQTVSAPVAQLAELPDSQRGPIASAPIASVSSGATVVVAADDRPRLPPAGALRKPALEIANVEWLPTAAAPKSESAAKRAAKLAGVLLLLAIVVAFACAPMIVKSLVVSGAADRGIALTVDRVEVSRRSIRLVDVRATAQDLPGATAHATAVEIALSHFVPTRIAVADADVALEGTRAEVGSRIDRWRAAHEKRLSAWVSDVEEVAIASGRIDWRGAMGPRSKVVVENVSFQGKGGHGRALVDDYHLTAPLLSLTADDVTAGPWKLDVDRHGFTTRSELRLDPSGTFAATVSWTTRDDGSASLELAVPRVGLADVHVPPAILGGGALGATRIEMRGKLEVAAAKAPGRPLQGRLFVGASSVAVFPNAPPVDVAVDLPIAGDATKPIVVDRAVVAVTSTDTSLKRTTQHATAYLAGALDDTGTKLSLDLAGRSTSVPCTPRGETHLDARLAFALDVAATKLVLVPQPACTPRLR